MAQLRLAYSALVRSANTFGSIAEGHQLVWYCITLILDMIRDLALEGQNLDTGSRQRLHRLHLTLISTVSSLPLPLMIRALEEIKSIITRCPQSDSGVEREQDEVKEERRKELVDALFQEISEKVGEQEKEAAMRWWYAHREAFLNGNHGMRAEVDKKLHSNVVSRL